LRKFGIKTITMEGPYLVTIKKTAELLGFKSVKPVERLIREKKIKTVVVNNRRMVVRESIYQKII